MLGRISLPYLSTYNSSKYAAEAFSDSLRLEVKPWGVRVHIIEPTFYKTRIIAEERKTFENFWKEQPRDVKDEITEHKFNSCKHYFFCFNCCLQCLTSLENKRLQNISLFQLVFY